MSPTCFKESTDFNQQEHHFYENVGNQFTGEKGKEKRLIIYMLWDKVLCNDEMFYT